MGLAAMLVLSRRDRVSGKMFLARRDAVAMVELNWLVYAVPLRCS
jgi:hypothetical protein